MDFQINKLKWKYRIFSKKIQTSLILKNYTSLIIFLAQFNILHSVFLLDENVLTNS